MPADAPTTTETYPEPVRRFVDGLSDEHRLLLVLRRELYDGDWWPMVTDLRNRLDGRPYVIRLASRITDDLARIEQMRALEEAYGVDLSRYVSVETENLA